MDDSISRQAAIDAMCELMHHWFGGDAKDEVREINRELGELLSAQPEPRWIPVEERLPREGQKVLVTDEYDEIDIAYFIDHSNIGSGIEWWVHDFRCYPIAWSELPKPYERSEE